MTWDLGSVLFGSAPRFLPPSRRRPAGPRRSGTTTLTDVGITRNCPAGSTRRPDDPTGDKPAPGGRTSMTVMSGEFLAGRGSGFTFSQTTGPASSLMTSRSAGAATAFDCQTVNQAVMAFRWDSPPHRRRWRRPRTCWTILTGRTTWPDGSFRPGVMT
jgi:hypothetical protein